MVENTWQKSPDELKDVVKRRATEEGIDLLDPRNRLTLWSENGRWSEGACHLLFEGSAAGALKGYEVQEYALKCGGSRLLILDATRGRIDIVPPSQAVAAFGSR